jgi:predicted ATPase/DNA-binding winged helix-turn-helix (wHTH) protein
VGALGCLTASVDPEFLERPGFALLGLKVYVDQAHQFLGAVLRTSEICPGRDVTQHLKPVYAYQGWEIDLARRELRLRGALVPIGGRAFEIIEVLVQAAGETLNKFDLISRVWPGAVVEENTLQFHISAVRKALGSDRGMLKTAFGRGYRLLGEWEIREESASHRTDASEQPLGDRPLFLNNLPAALTELIGRAVAVKQLQDFLSAYRVVTLIGPGGVGKTTLALEVARRLFPTFRGDAMFVELASLSDSNLVPSAVATNLGQQLGGSQIVAHSIAQSIGRKRLLLVLDNCEHLINAVAQLTETLVRMCPDVTVLATSREPLRIEGEHVYRVPPLDVPGTDYRDQSDALQHSAVQLFIARSRHHSNLPSQEENFSAIASICRRLDGMPLAIEFAAAHAATLGVQHVAARLNDRFDLLTVGRRTALPRHQTLRATLDWSYQLLSEREQYLLRHLAVFPAGFTVDAATAVTGNSEGTARIEERISSLVWKSVLTLDNSSGDTRWRLLETIRAYALDRLAENGEAEEAARRQARFFRDLFAPSDKGPLVALEDLPRYIREIDNVRAALNCAFSPAGDRAVAVALTAAYAPVWLHLSLIAECRSRLECAVNILAADSCLSPSLKAQLLTIFGIVLVYTVGANERTRLALAEALEIAESLDDPEAQLQALYAMWIHRFNNGEHTMAQCLAERIAHIAPHTGDRADMLLADRLLGSTNHYGGDQRRARHHYESLLDRHMAPSGRRRAMWLHYDDRVLPQARLARVLWMQGFAKEAIEAAKASLEDAHTANHKLSVSFALGEALSPIYLMSGDIGAASQHIAMLSQLAERHGFDFWIRFGHCLEGALLIKQGDAARGSTLLRSALEDLGSSGQTLHCSGFIGDFAEALASLGDSVEASTMIDNALAQSRREGVLWHVPELLRMKGELSMQQFGHQSLSTAEGLFLEAIALAREQTALFWELRTAVSLARLKIWQHQPAEAHTLLAEICGAFAGEVDFSDLGAARKLLSSLPAHQPGENRPATAPAPRTSLKKPKLS